MGEMGARMRKFALADSQARRLMLREGLEAASASYRVGYESPSHFSREYSRMFGAPPRADVCKLRGEQRVPA